MTRRQTVALAAAAVAALATMVFSLYYESNRGTFSGPEHSSNPKQEMSHPQPESPPERIQSSSGNQPQKVGRIPRALDISIADFSKEFDSLAARAASGDSEAAYQLYLGTASCKDAAQDPNDLNGRIGEIQRNEDDAAHQQAQIDFAKHRFLECSKLTLSQRDSWKRWLRRAAALGQSDAKLRYVLAGESSFEGGNYWQNLDEYRTKAAEYLRDELQRGNADALLATAATYDGSSNLKLFKPDTVKNYAYMYGYLLATDQKSGPFLERLAGVGAGMGKSDLCNAEQMGKDIYEHCCKH